MLEINCQQYFPFNMDFLALVYHILLSSCFLQCVTDKNLLSRLNKDGWVMSPCLGHVFIFTYRQSISVKIVGLKFSHMERGSKVLWNGNHFDVTKTEKTQTESSNIQPLLFTESTVDSIKMQDKFQLKTWNVD